MSNHEAMKMYPRNDDFGRAAFDGFHGGCLGLHECVWRGKWDQLSEDQKLAWIDAARSVLEIAK
jgi:hypothetical protein